MELWIKKKNPKITLSIVQQVDQGCPTSWRSLTFLTWNFLNHHVLFISSLQCQFISNPLNFLSLLHLEWQNCSNFLYNTTLLNALIEENGDDLFPNFFRLFYILDV
jgi:hypothetical protein